MKFPPQARLTDAADFRFVFSQPGVSRDCCFRILSRPNNRERSRLGLAVSARLCRRASGRNRLKRVIRESFRHHQAMLCDENAMDIVVLPLPEAIGANNRTLFASLDMHWRKLASMNHSAGGRKPFRQGKGKN